MRMIMMVMLGPLIILMMMPMVR